ncbi:MAG: glycine--tRNA ligase subunit beta [Alphaproteobacteria bacterium 16-39-46]|nr:MAG: glycine--tRNA ligase subunit beta [Alphaproteobacteria bacterium 16-39-46]OZA41428.1 MAG: glycine--tRNA ligase subunit beta [Alphaproteobacteria bacterium 17-39-52]HQS83959.1 glycine--tRNA ligase subunit beta [Alphaproteobacteria bacterium]HQS93805.1 glycine--tRNA ligase subunit beta [Alphaproteobacteria bacterium]
MKSFFFEILSEEIPARMQFGACETLKNLLAAALKEERLSFESVTAYVTPRRLVGVVQGLTEIQDDFETEIRGPRIDAPAQAIEGFLKSQNLPSLEACTQQESPKGAFWMYRSFEKGKKTEDLLGALVERLIQNFPWPKSMRWGDQDLSWVRPIRGILALFGDHVIPVTVGRGVWRVTSSNSTWGHRFLSPVSFEVQSFEDYVQKLKEHFVLLDQKERKQKIWEDALKVAQGQSLQIVPDEGLLDEITGLVEWPIPLLGEIQKNFMALPREVLTTSMRVHQRYFSLKKEGEKELAPFFIVVSNGFSPASAHVIIQNGNESVLRARLSDALFFWEQDQKTSLEAMLTKLKTRVFQKGLGSLYDKAERLKDLGMGQFGSLVLESIGLKEETTLKQCGRAGFLAKADLVSTMVGEFPELQGIMGSYYAALQGEAKEVSEAIYDQYDLWSEPDVLEKKVSMTLALADRLDTLVGFFGLGLLPTGSKDPYALRRSALGVIRLLRCHQLDVSLKDLMIMVLKSYQTQGITDFEIQKTVQKLLEFFEERLKVSLKDQGVSPDRVAACLTGTWFDNIPRACRLAEALDSFLKSKEGGIFLTVYRRASHILKESPFDPLKEVQPGVFQDPSETLLWDVLQKAQAEFGKGFFDKKDADFNQAFLILSNLAPALHSFFETVQVNSPDAMLRDNRLLLLKSVVDLFERLAEFSKIEKEGGKSG